MALMITDREGGCMGRVPKSVPGRETGLWERLPNSVMGAGAVGWNVYNSFSLFVLIAAQGHRCRFYFAPFRLLVLASSKLKRG